MLFWILLIIVLTFGILFLVAPYLGWSVGTYCTSEQDKRTPPSPLRDIALICTAVFATYAGVSSLSRPDSPRITENAWPEPQHQTSDPSLAKLEQWMGRDNSARDTGLNRRLGQRLGLKPAGAKKAGVSQPNLPSVGDMVAKLETRLKSNPDDVEGWRMLGWSYFRTGDFQRSADAYARAVKLDGKSSKIQSVYGEALVRAAKGEVTKTASAAFKAAVTLDPKNPRARFFLGMEKQQKMDPKGALDDWISLLKEAEADSGWATNLRVRIVKLAKQSRIDIANRLPKKRAASATEKITRLKIADHVNHPGSDRLASTWCGQTTLTL